MTELGVEIVQYLHRRSTEDWHLVIRSQPAEHEISIRQRLFHLISPSSRFIQESLPLLHYGFLLLPNPTPTRRRTLDFGLDSAWDRYQPDHIPRTIFSSSHLRALNLSFLFRHNRTHDPIDITVEWRYRCSIVPLDESI